MAYVLGIDIGTYESKGALVDETGKLLVSKSVAHHLEIPQKGWAEHDAEQTWWHDFTHLSRTITQQAVKQHGIRPEEIKAVGVSSIAPAVVPVDSAGKPLRKAILYGVDTRSQKQILRLNESAGEEQIFRVAGQTLSAQSAGPKILWIREEEPLVYERTAKFLCGSGYLVYKLTGEMIIDRYTAASYSPLFDIHELQWNREMASGICEVDQLPRLVWSHEIVGEVTNQASAQTGLAPGTKVIAGTADALSEAISVGAVHTGDLMLMYGSSTFFILVSPHLPITKTLWANLHATPGRHTITGGTATAGSLTRWFIDHCLSISGPARSMNVDEAYTYATRLAEQSPPGAGGLLTLPYFSGERTPIHHAAAKGVFFGLTLHHTQSDMYRSILEGISFSIRHNMDEIRSMQVPITRAIAVGGGVKNRLWLQCVSDICQVTQVIPEITLGAAYGNAFLCALGLGWYSDLSDMDRWVRVQEEITPSQTHRAIYERHYELYQRLYRQTRDLMDELT
ncbi:FGGY-family carbohydrate kinase [Brevibacillus choshinensis]|uniref:FGGY-family carbohydrate kinase n=1 Tax=Brevibacillus choshinensis TaxID=54911 RepID=A0ABX7FQE2_BRECH|nr:FGGY-family carbohydrate kinase [Brevibacillus choshinensis]QRG68321.1 FGGY-family carbohydrate kinase [Brevibacillus choshinensis]